MAGFCTSQAAFTRLSGFSLLAQLEKQLGVLDHAFLEAEGFAAGRVGLGGSGPAEQPAEVAKVFLVGGRFFALVPVPLPFELRRSHCRMIQPAQQRMVNDSKREAWQMGFRRAGLIFPGHQIVPFA